MKIDQSIVLPKAESPRQKTRSSNFERVQFFFLHILAATQYFLFVLAQPSMSKRERDEGNVSSMQAILGDIPITTIKNLLYRSNNNVEAALNLYFTNPSTTSSPIPTTTSPTKNKHNTDSKVFAGKKYYIGDLVITGN